MAHGKLSSHTPALLAEVPIPALLDEESPLLPKHGCQDQDSQTSTLVAGSNEKLSRSKTLWIMSSIWIGTFVAGLGEYHSDTLHLLTLAFNIQCPDGTVMATLAAPIATSFNSLPLLAWLATAFLIGQAATQPLSGKLTDIFSRQWGLIISSVIFASGNIICGLAGEEWTMILGRLIAGIGGGSVNAIATILISDLIPLRQRGIWQGINNVFWGLGHGLGGIFGGYINDTWDWRVAFLTQVPFTLVSLLIVCALFKDIRSQGPQKTLDSPSSFSRVDFLGGFLLVATLVLFLLGLTTGGNIVPWTHPLPSASLPTAALLFYAFIYVEQKVAREPILPLHFLYDRTVLSACLTNGLFHMAIYTFVFYVPILYHVRGVSTTQAGAALIPFSFGLPLGSLIAGAIATRTGRFRYLLWAILVMMLASAIATCTITPSTPLWLPRVYMGSIGIATGGMLVATLLAVLTSVDESEQALVTSLSFVFRSTGAVVGLVVASAVYQQVLEKDLWDHIGGLNDAADVIKGVRESLDYVATLPQQTQAMVLKSYMLALNATFKTTAAFTAVALVCGLFVRDLELQSSTVREEAEYAG
ncbi:MAG: hypothetical protein LQ352_004243 [Teloschistes flavicans]|nr:MAG: hypothetical protein LQ352_004243 [Teloschistes flavicans]